MAKSLQDQLMGAGLVDNKKAKAIKQQQRKQKKQQPKGQAQADENKQRMEFERKAKIEKDRALNKEIKAAAVQKGLLAQIRQLIELNKLDTSAGELGYQFAEGTKIRKIFVNATQQEQLSRGLLAVVKQDDRYLIVPSVVAEKIAQRNATVVVALNEKSASENDDDDPYKDYQIPDDLMW
jgi:hypothetical protein